MEVNRLLGDEMACELQIRRLPIQKLFAENGSTLRWALRIDRKGISSVINVDKLNPGQEYDICKEKLIEKDVQNVDKQNYLY